MVKNVSYSADPLKIYDQMSNEIKNSGGLFYQYRACTRSYATIYDIDNIRNGVVFARPPLEMNDPFDSQIGFSVEELSNECIDMLLKNFSAGDFEKSLLSILLKHKILGQFAEFLKAINDLKLYLIKQRRTMYKSSMSLEKFVNYYGKNLYNKLPSSIKQIINKNNFLPVFKLAAHFENTEITEDNLHAFLQTEEKLDDLHRQIENIMNNIYIPFLRKLLAKMPISCFSAAGWNSPLMWAHYANAYKGICVEYDFNKLSNFVGIFKQVQYSSQRPTILLKDIGVEGFALGQKTTIKYTDPNFVKIFNYLLTKDICWNYEKEWRIITICDSPVNQHFFPVPFIRSITMGLNVDYLCQRLILDVCQEKGIECYRLKLEHDNFKISREKIDIENIEYDGQVELDYIQLLLEDIVNSCESIVKLSNDIIPDMKNGGFNGLALKVILEKILSYLEGVYFLKLAYNRFCSNLPESVDVPSEIQENIGQLEITTRTIHESILELTNIIQQALAGGNTGSDTRNDYMKTFGTVQDIYEKYQSIRWHNVL